MRAELQKEIRWLLQEKYEGKRTARAQEDIARLDKGEHVDYVIGWVNFLGCKIDLSRRPLIPRPETEYWTGQVAQELRRGIFRNRDPYSSPPAGGSSPRPNPTISQNPSPTLHILDLFAGSGCIGIAILKHVPVAHVDFAEKERAFCKQIEINAQLNGIDKRRYCVLQSDIFSNIAEKYDVILANPPYVAESQKDNVQKSVLEQEPYGGVFGGKDGLQYIREFLAQVKNYLTPSGVVYVEFDSRQKAEIGVLTKKAGAKNVNIRKDQYGKWRYARMSF